MHPEMWTHSAFCTLSFISQGLGKVSSAQAYTSKRRILIQVLPVPNAYTKSGDAYIHFA